MNSFTTSSGSKSLYALNCSQYAVRRFSSEEKNQIIYLRKRGKSLIQICRFLKRGKSTVYYHLRKNFGRSYKLIEINLSDQGAVGEVMGLFASDGSAVPQSDYQIRFHLDANEEEYMMKFMSVLNKVFNKMPRTYKVRNSKVLIYSSKPIYGLVKEYLDWEGKKTYTIRLKSLHHSKKFLIGFLRGYFDGDGYSKRDQRLAQFITTSKNMYNHLQEILSNFNLDFYSREYHDRRENRHTAYYIFLRRLDAIKFINLVKPRNPKRVKSWARSIAWSSKLD